MKQLFFSALLLLASVGIVRAEATTSDPMRPDIVCFGNVYFTEGSTAPFCLDMDGDMIPGRNITFDIGESTRSYRYAYVNGVEAVAGLSRGHETFVALSSGQIRGASLAGKSGFSISTATLRGAATSYNSYNIQQPTGAPRNIILSISSSPQNAAQGSANGITTTTLVGAVTFYGYNSAGKFTSELIYFSTGTLKWSTATVSNSNIFAAQGVGNIAWAYISSFSVQITTMSDAYGLSTSSPVLNIGYGNKIGLAGNISAASDVYMVLEAGGENTTNNSALSINTTYDWVAFPTTPNGVDNKQVWYVIRRSWE